MENNNEAEEVIKSNSINLSFDGIPESTKEEVLNPPAKLIGQVLSGIVHAVFDPLLKFNIIRDQELKDFQKKIHESTKEIPEENRDDEKIGLALKAFEESKYQLDSEELRTMFAKLISSTIDNRKNHEVQPSFSSVLKDLTTEDAKLVKLFFEEKTTPLVSIRILDEEKEAVLDLKKDILLFNNTISTNALSLYSLERLGIISINSDSELKSTTNQNKYKSFENNNFYLDVKKDIPMVMEDFTFNIVTLLKGQVSITPFGKAFMFCIF